MEKNRATTQAGGWEHRQVDLQIDPDVDGIAPIYTFGPPPLRLLGVVESGSLVDLLLLDSGRECRIESVERPAISLEEEPTERSTLCRSWHVDGPDISIHAEVWVDAEGKGFADLFARRLR